MRITCVHQGHELYGSDRAFIMSVCALARNYPDATLDVLIPRPGPIEAELQRIGCAIRHEPMLILRKSAGITGLLRNVARTSHAIRAAREVIYSSDLTYVNTCVVADYYLAARSSGRRVVGHIHEIPLGLSRIALRSLVDYAGIPVIFNSAATAAAFEIQRQRIRPIVHNGCTGPRHTTRPHYDGTKPLRVLMLGRISTLKGQDLLLDAALTLNCTRPARFIIRIIGSAFQNPKLERAVHTKAMQGQLREIVTVEPFIFNPSTAYEWADIVVIPSRRPESFGLVAIEAMAHARPVIAAAHGGIIEVVQHGRTGWLFQPNNASDLARCIEEAIRRPDLVVSYGAAGRQVYEQTFTERAYEQRFTSVISQMFDTPAPG